jgi:hypothetical protein
MEALGALLAQSGRSCRLLGARTPSTTLVITARQVDPAAVIVVSHLSIGRRAAMDAVRAVAALGVPTFYAGNAFIAAPIRQRLPGRYLGDSIRAAARIVESVPSA